LVRTPLLQATTVSLAPLESDVFMSALPRGHVLGAQGALLLSELANEPL